ncbi:MAG: phosphate/phosphite/phosphonate ABC transporter substrate-binding protein [Gammaproteobacteria bacterium]|nr:phosphate/phosphite/phosphonate ABC transporter substrate-binding protein [Gammaproteobacteria bacterium]
MRKIFFIAAVLSLLPFPTMAENNTAAMTLNEIVFTAPPKESPEAGRERYEPIAEYLSQVLGKKVVYKHPGNWLIFRTHMLKGNYDLIFDDGHLNSYRAANLNHTILAKAATPNRFAVIVANGSVRYQTLKDLVGRSICTQAPPDLASIIVLNNFDNPSRQPRIVTSDDWGTIYENVQSKKCTAGVLPLAALDKLENSDHKSKVIFLTDPLPHLAFSAGPRLSQSEKLKIAGALVASESNSATAKLRSAMLIDSGFVPASNNEYVGLAKYLENQLGYY